MEFEQRVDVPVLHGGSCLRAVLAAETELPRARYIDSERVPPIAIPVPATGKCKLIASEDVPMWKARRAPPLHQRFRRLAWLASMSYSPMRSGVESGMVARVSA